MKKKKIKNPLIRRIPRELTGDWKKYLVVSLFLILMIGFVSGMYVANESMMTAADEGVGRYKLEDDDSVLFMWVTMPFLEEAFDVMRSWGFEYKTCAFTWIKQNKKADTLFWGMGNWTRANAELCLLGVRGKPKRMDAGVHSVIMSHIEEHSKKPAETRDRIVKLMAGGGAT